MKILIYEITHLECVLSLAEILRDSHYEITFFVHEKMKNEIETAISCATRKYYRWIFVKDEHILARYRHIEVEIRKNRPSILWIHTADSKLLMFTMLSIKYPKIRIVVNIHEVNDLLKPYTDIKFIIQYICKKTFINRIGAFIVNSQKMKNYIDENKLSKTPCFVLPVTYYQSVPNYSRHKFTVVISGTIESKRRDYVVALSAWKLFLSKMVTDEYPKLILAGSAIPNGKNIIKICSEDPLLKISVVIYMNEIPQLLFNKILLKSSVLLSPLNIKTFSSSKTPEIYGITKNSGNVYDSIKYGLPVIWPEEMEVLPELVSSSLYYKNPDDLSDLLQTLYEDHHKLQSLHSAAKVNAGKFSLREMRLRTKKILQAITNL